MGVPEQVDVVPPGTVMVAVAGFTDTITGIDNDEQPTATFTLT
jgi:hypothetical protein